MTWNDIEQLSLIQTAPGPSPLALDMIIMTFWDDWNCSRAGEKLIIESRFSPRKAFGKWSQVNNGHWGQGHAVIGVRVTKFSGKQ